MKPSIKRSLRVLYVGSAIAASKLVNCLCVFQVAIQVSETGKVTIISQEINETIKEHIPNINQIIEHSISELPEIKPALKKIQSGELVPVKTQFVIPIRVVAKITDN